MASALDNSVTQGRLGVITLTTAYGTLVAGTTATNPVQNIGTGNAGDILVSAGAGAVPVWTAGGLPIAATQAQMEAGASATTYVSPARAQYHPSAAKAWGKITTAATVTTLVASYNIATVTRTATGTHTWEIATDFSSAHYGYSISAQSAGFLPITAGLTTPTAGLFYSYTNNSAFAPADADSTSFIAFGDQV